MTWVTWRQARLENMLGLATLAVVAVILLWAGHDAHAAYKSAGLSSCVASHSAADDCVATARGFIERFSNLDGLVLWLAFLPLIWGLLLAAPAMLDMEQGTYRLAWTQSVSRGKWFATKIGVGIVASVVISTVWMELWTWWRHPIDAINGRFDGTSFDFEGIAPIAYTVFAFALCLTLGVLLRRAIPAIGLSLVGFFVARFLIEGKLRPHYQSPISLTWSPTDPVPAAATLVNRLGAGDWILSQSLVGEKAGNLAAVGGRVSVKGVASGTCIQSAGGDQNAINRCLAAEGFMNKLIYQPASRFWLFQGIEFGIFVGLSALLLGVSVWWILRRMG